MKQTNDSLRTQIEAASKAVSQPEDLQKALEEISRLKKENGFLRDSQEQQRVCQESAAEKCGKLEAELKMKKTEIEEMRARCEEAERRRRELEELIRYWFPILLIPGREDSDNIARERIKVEQGEKRVHDFEIEISKM